MKNPFKKERLIQRDTIAFCDPEKDFVLSLDEIGAIEPEERDAMLSDVPPQFRQRHRYNVVHLSPWDRFYKRLRFKCIILKQNAQVAWLTLTNAPDPFDK